MKIKNGNLTENKGFEKNLSNAERQKILEFLMSQERVLTLLYDKTFPPRS